MNTMTKRTFATVTSSSATDDEPSMIISTANIDRDNDIIEPSGGEFAAYLTNPVVGWQHLREGAMPIGSTTRLAVERDGIRATWRWLQGDPLADRVRNAFEQGVIRAASIGFHPIAWEPLGNGGRRYTRWELLEWSLVAVPSNRQSVRVLRSLDLWDGDEALITLPDADNPLLLDLIGDIDEPTLDVAEETFEVDERAAGRAIAASVREGLREAVSAAVRRELDIRRGRLVDDGAWSHDPDVRRVKNAEARADFSRADIAAAAREAMPDILCEVVTHAVRRGVRMATGKLD